MSLTVPAIEAELAYRACERITRAEAANFYYGIRLLPRPKREAMSAVYAFARRVDDIGDAGVLAPDVQLARLSRERSMLARIARDGAVLGEDSVSVALAHACRRYGLPLDALELLVDGVELDVRAARFDTFEELVHYGRAVAGSIGRLCLAIFAGGRWHEPAGAADLADALGVAMQLTNILRDVREDQARGRCYLPAEDLERFGCPEFPEGDPVALAALIGFEAGRAQQWFARGLRLVGLLDARSASCVLAMTGIYRTILARIAAAPETVLHGRVALTPGEKAWVAARSLVLARRAGGQG